MSDPGRLATNGPPTVTDHRADDAAADRDAVVSARQVLRDHRPSDDLWPTRHVPKLRAAAEAKYAEYLEHEVGNL